MHSRENCKGSKTVKNKKINGVSLWRSRLRIQCCHCCGLSFFFFFFSLPYFLLFRAAPAAYGSSCVKGQIGAVAAGLHHSDSNSGSEPCLQATPQLTTMWNMSNIYDLHHSYTNKQKKQNKTLKTT